MSDRTPAIIDLSDKEPDSREWQKLERYVREYACQTVKGIMASKNTPTVPSTDKGNLKMKHETELIRKGLERYRAEPPDSNIRKGIDWLLQRHARWEKFMQSDSLFRKRHNALVLEYIISRPMTHTVIEKRLGISDNGFKNQIEKGINELAQILFGYREWHSGNTREMILQSGLPVFAVGTTGNSFFKGRLINGLKTLHEPVTAFKDI